MIVDESLFPPGFREVVALVGLRAARGLVEQYGGLEIHVPTRCHDDMALAKAVGWDAAGKLVCRYGGTRLYVPKCHAALIAARDAEIVARYEGGESVRVLAREYGLTERWIWQILRQSQGWVNGDLFGEG